MGKPVHAHACKRLGYRPTIEVCTHEMRRTLLTHAGSDPGDKIKEVVVGGKAFCQSLHKYAGNPGDPDPNQRPKEFLEEIDDVMEIFEKAQKQTVKPVKLKNKNGTTKKHRNGEIKMGKRQQSCITLLNSFFEPKSGRTYLPPKDITHLLVFQSRLAADTFQVRIVRTVCVWVCGRGWQFKTQVMKHIHTHLHMYDV